MQKHSFYSEFGEPYEPLSKREMEVLAQIDQRHEQ